jgi:hypothetical protein
MRNLSRPRDGEPHHIAGSEAGWGGPDSAIRGRSIGLSSSPLAGGTSSAPERSFRAPETAERHAKSERLRLFILIQGVARWLQPASAIA